MVANYSFMGYKLRAKICQLLTASRNMPAASYQQLIASCKI